MVVLLPSFLREPESKNICSVKLEMLPAYHDPVVIVKVSVIELGEGTTKKKSNLETGRLQ